MVRKNAPTRRTESKKPSSSPSRQRKTHSKGVLHNLPIRHWGWNSLSVERKLDILGVFLALLGLISILSLLSTNRGSVTGWWIAVLRNIAGLGSFILPIVLILVGIWLVLRNVERLPLLSLERITGLVLLYFNLLGWLHILFNQPELNGWELAEMGGGGGYLGALSTEVFISALGKPATVIVLAAWSLISTALTLDISVSELFSFLQKILAGWARRINKRIAAERDAKSLMTDSNHKPGPAQSISELPSDFKPLNQPAQVGLNPLMPSQSQQSGQSSLRRAGQDEVPPSQRPGRRGKADQPDHLSQSDPALKGNSPPVTAQKAVQMPPWQLPNIANILEQASQETAKPGQDQERGKLIEDTLASFGAPVRVVATNHGPTVTQFGVEPLYIENRNGQTRVRVSKIVALADDLALALAAPRIRIQAPVPGRNYVGIEVPNLEVSRVYLRDVMETDQFRKIKSPIRFALGKDVAGHPKVYDLANMPHLLIAGTTGSGKSVLVNAILSCFLLNNTPNDLRMILVDPKRVELTGYNGIPHLLAPVVVEAEQVVGALQWVQREMDARYHRFSQAGTRNIADYNSRNYPPLPYMLVLIDELADLMMLAPDETERSLTRLAQLARATGIHLVLATQRPSVDVVTGLIKANFPARVAFAVASGTDSRVILDQPGAERLLGRGDMLFQAPDAAAPVRLQGVWVSDPEIQQLVEYWRQQAYDLRDLNFHPPTAEPVNMDLPPNTPLKQTPLWGDEGNGKPEDPILLEAIRIVREEGKASISMLQRKLRIGYTRSARLIEKMEEQGIIGPAVSSSQVREVLDIGENKDASVGDHLANNEVH